MRDSEPRLDPIGTKLRRFAIHAFRTLRFAVVDLGHWDVGICRCCPKGGSAAALAQSAPPKVGNKPLVHVKTLRCYWTNIARLPWSTSVFGRNARVEQKVRVPG